MEPISAAELIKRLENGEKMHLLDVRENIEFMTYNIGGKNIPLSKMATFLDLIEYNKTDELIVICTIGLRSETARLILHENGFVNTRNLTGGIMALQKINTNKTF